ANAWPVLSRKGREVLDGHPIHAWCPVIGFHLVPGVAQVLWCQYPLQQIVTQGWVYGPTPRSRPLLQVCLRRVGHASSLASLFGPPPSPGGTGRGLLCPRLTAPRGSARLARALSQFPWPATAQDATELSPDKTVRGRGTSGAFTLPPSSPDFAVLCSLVP